MSDAGTRPTGLREDSGSRSGWGSVLLTLAVAVLILGGVYVGAALYFKDRPPAGVSVAGVDIGTLTREEAEETLARQLADRTTDPLTLQVRPEGAAEEETQDLLLVPEDAGLSLDLERTLDGVTGLSFDPRTLWAHVAGAEHELPLRAAVDRAALEAELTRLAADYDQDPVEGEVSLGEEGVVVVDAQEGRTLDVAATADTVEQAWLDQPRGEEPAPTDVPLAGSASAVAPQLTAAEIERFTSEELDPALAAPVRVTATRGEGEDEQSATAELAVRDLRDMLSVRQGADHRLALDLDGEAALTRIRQDLGQLEAGPQDASVRLDGDEVVTVPSRDGYALEEDGLVDAVRGALSATGEARTVEASLRVVEPEIPTSASEAWTFEPMGSFTSQFPTYPGNEARTANLRAGVSHVNGTVVMPGEQFSLGAALGDISEEAGYVEAPVIIDGRLVMGLGGGLSQVSTVVLNTSWASGVQLDAHTPHSFYIPRYPAGIEATIAIPVIDNLWTNDTDTPVVVRSWITGDVIHMTYLGERQYDVQTWVSERRDPTTGERIEDASPECVPQTPSDGFTITAVRILSQGGTEVHRDEYTTTYKPADEIVCTGPVTP